MKSRNELRKMPCAGQRCKRIAAALLLVALSLCSCSRKGKDALTNASSSPAAPVLSNSPDTPGTVIPKASPDRKLFKTGEVVPAGYLGYKVYGSWFTDHLSPQGAARKSSASFLYIDLSVVNTDKKERAVGPFKLVDEKGRETPLSEKASAIEQSVGQLAKLAPNVSKRVVAIFEVPGGHQYKLRIRGFTDEDAVLIELSPAATPPAK